MLGLELIWMLAQAFHLGLEAWSKLNKNQNLRRITLMSKDYDLDTFKLDLTDYFGHHKPFE